MKFVNNFGFQMSIFFRKTFHDFPKILTKSLIHKIKEHKILNFFWQVQIDEIKKKMSKIIKKPKNQ